MPELPEVETTVRSIRPLLVGRRIERTTVLWERTMGGGTAAAFARALEGARVREVLRRAKWIVIRLERRRQDSGVLCIHLRMSGRLSIGRAGEPAGPWERVRIELEGGRALRFDDPRKFGRMIAASRVDQVLPELGPEPLGKEFTREGLARALRGRRRALKPLLLDQRFVAGLGNIYVDESLHRAGLHPRARADRLGPAQVRALWSAIRAVLRGAIARRAEPSGVSYRTPGARRRRAPDRFEVYDRAGRPCGRCGTAIRRIVVGQRGTWYCSRCQAAPRAAAATRRRN